MNDKFMTILHRNLEVKCKRRLEVCTMAIKTEQKPLNPGPSTENTNTESESFSFNGSLNRELFRLEQSEKNGWLTPKGEKLLEATRAVYDDPQGVSEEVWETVHTDEEIRNAIKEGGGSGLCIATEKFWSLRSGRRIT